MVRVVVTVSISSMTQNKISAVWRLIPVYGSGLPLMNKMRVAFALVALYLEERFRFCSTST